MQNPPPHDRHQETLMDDLPGRHGSLWAIDVDQTDYPPLDMDVSVDVAVVGGESRGSPRPRSAKTRG